MKPITAPARWILGNEPACLGWAPTWSSRISGMAMHFWNGSSKAKHPLHETPGPLRVDFDVTSDMPDSSPGPGRPPLDLKRLKIFPLAERRSLTRLEDVLV